MNVKIWRGVVKIEVHRQEPPLKAKDIFQASTNWLITSRSSEGNNGLRRALERFSGSKFEIVRPINMKTTPRQTGRIRQRWIFLTLICFHTNDGQNHQMFIRKKMATVQQIPLAPPQNKSCSLEYFFCISSNWIPSSKKPLVWGTYGRYYITSPPWTGILPVFYHYMFQ